MVHQRWCAVFGLIILLSQVMANPFSRRNTGREGDVRLVGGLMATNNWFGRVEIFHSNQWGTVCDDGVGVDDARVICRGLGYTAGTMMSNPFSGSGQVWMDELQCHPSDTSLVECSHDGWGEENCFHSEDIGVVCWNPGEAVIDPPSTEPGPAEGEVRLVGGVRARNNWFGRVEIFHSNQWGTVCDDGVGVDEAVVICRGLGYTEGTLINPSSGSGPTWMDEVKCHPSDISLVECEHNGWGEENCSHNEDIGVICWNPAEANADQPSNEPGPAGGLFYDRAAPGGLPPDLDEIEGTSLESELSSVNEGK